MMMRDSTIYRAVAPARRRTTMANALSAHFCSVLPRAMATRAFVWDLEAADDDDRPLCVRLTANAKCDRTDTHTHTGCAGNMEAYRTVPAN